MDSDIQKQATALSSLQKYQQQTGFVDYPAIQHNAKIPYIESLYSQTISISSINTSQGSHFHHVVHERLLS